MAGCRRRPCERYWSPVALLVVLLIHVPAASAEEPSSPSAQPAAPSLRPAPLQRRLAPASAPASSPAPPPAPPPVPASPAEPVNDAALYVAVMLFGGVAFIMVLFYLLHWEDEDVRGYNWSVISASICTFTGVLLGMSWSRCFNTFVIGPPEVAGPYKTIAADLGAALGWYVILQIVLSRVSGANGTPEQKAARNETGRVSTVLNLKCFAVLLGVTNGASNMNLWGFVQQEVPRDIVHLTAVPFLAVCCLWALFQVGRMVRTRIARNGDDKVDHWEALWERYTEGTEDGAVSMAASHLLVQVVRFQITGVLPLAGGQMRPGAPPTSRDAQTLFFVAFVFVMGIPGVDLGLKFKSAKANRIKGWLKTMSANCASFCWIYAFTWQVEVIHGHMGPAGSLMVALLVSLFGFVLVLLLDKVADASWTGESIDREIVALVAPISLLIGFSWKQAFVASMTAIDGRVAIFSAPVQTLALAIVLAMIVVPAWRMYILPVVMHHEIDRQKSRGTDLSAEMKLVHEHMAPLMKPLMPVEPLTPPPAPVLAPQSGRRLSSVELEQQNSQLMRRNQDLEAYIRDIKQEVGNLKKTLSFIR